MRKLCLVITDAVSFNILCKGQLEFFRDQGRFELTLVCGGRIEEVERLRDRNVGKVHHLKMQRKPSFLADLRCLIELSWFFLFNRFDLVVYSTPKALLLASIAAFFSKQRMRVAIIRGRIYENHSGWTRTLWSYLDKVACLLSHKVVFISRSLRTAYLAEGILPSKKCYVLGAGSSNGVDVTRFAPIEKNRRHEILAGLEVEPSEGDFVVSVIGRVCVDKGIEDVFAVACCVKNSNVKFLVVGPVEDEHTRSIIDRLTVKCRNVFHVGAVDDTSKIHGIADLHLFLSHREGFGNVAIEAASCGVLTVAYDVVGVRDSVADGISGQRFPFRDIAGVAKYIDDAAENRDFVQVRSLRAREWARDNFDQSVVWDRYLDFFVRNAGGYREEPLGSNLAEISDTEKP